MSIAEIVETEYIIGEELNPRIVDVEPHRDYTLTLTFENGERKYFDMTPYIGRSVWFEELRDWSYFSQAKAEYGTVVWTHGQDLCPDTFYLKSVPIE
ncbi:MAG: DUF2442 domain-containing protein [Planctomycetaceae bacterium]|jgi:hypothetical protein|nr:DUF2442 domain-containing protein [Planctomycetaceae bacterium]